jgi:hypothetical protein
MNKKTIWICLVFGAAFLSYLVFSSFTGKRFRCEVCMQFDGATDCRTASSETREDALRTAVTNACAQLSSVVSQSIRCENTPPQSVRWMR